MDAFLAKAKFRSKHWKREVKAGAEKVARAERERDEAKEEAQVAWLAAIATGDSKARAEDDLTRVQEALSIAEEARRKAEAETSRPEVERTSLLLELRAAKDEVSSLHSQASKDKEAVEEDYQKTMELIFAYGYECCVFKYNICGDQPEVPDGMHDSSNPLPSEFFTNPKCPPASATTEVMAVEAEQSVATKESGKDAFAGNQS